MLPKSIASQVANVIHTEDCSGCKYQQKKPIKCIGCKQAMQPGSVVHCLKHCPKWLAGGPNEKAKILLDGKGCLQCTALWHPTDNEKCKIVPKKCRVEGCTLIHNQELHYAKDTWVQQVNVVRCSIAISSITDPNLH